MAKLTLATIANILIDPIAAALGINNNNAAIVAAVENTLSRDGTSPNQMLADLDLNGNGLLNASSLGVGRIDSTSIYINGEAVIPGQGGGGSGSGTVTSVAGRIGDVVLTKSDVGLAQVDNTSDASKPLSTASVSALAGKLNKTSNLSDLSNVDTARTNLGITAVGDSVVTAPDAATARSAILAAALASPTFTGIPIAPTATLGTNTTQIATTSFVAAAINALSSIYQPLASYLSNLVGLGSNGLVVKNGATASTVSISSGPSLIVTNGSGVAGNPTVTLNATSTTVDPINNEDIAFKRISDTSIRILMRGSDGVVRGVNLTVA